MFYAGNGLLYPFNLWLESGVGGSKHTSSHYLIITLSQRGEGVAPGDFLPSEWKLVLCFSYSTTTIIHFKTYTQIPSQAADFKTFPYLLWATILISPYFQPQVCLQSTTVPSRPGVQQSRCIISQTLVRDDTLQHWATHSQPVATSNKQQHKYSMRKPMPYQNATSRPADVSCSLFLCIGLYDIEHLALIGCQLLSKNVWRLSL